MVLFKQLLIFFFGLLVHIHAATHQWIIRTDAKFSSSRVGENGVHLDLYLGNSEWSVFATKDDLDLVEGVVSARLRDAKEKYSVQGWEHISKNQTTVTFWVGLMPQHVGRDRNGQLVDRWTKAMAGIERITGSDDKLRVDCNVTSAGRIQEWLSLQPEVTQIEFLPKSFVLAKNSVRVVLQGLAADMTKAWNDNPVSLLGLNGNGQILAIADTGIDVIAHFCDECAGTNNVYHSGTTACFGKTRWCPPSIV